MTYTLVEGGGASRDNVTITMDTSVIRVSGSDMLLESLHDINLGVINLANIKEDTHEVYPINLPEGVSNLSGVKEVNVDILLKGLAVREFTVDDIRVTGVPSTMSYELVTKQLTVTLRGPAVLINKMTADDLIVTADLSGKDEGTVMVNANVDTVGDTFDAVGALGNFSVSVILKDKTEVNG